MKISTPTIRIPSFTFRLDVLIGVLVLYLLIVCLLFGSCLKISFTEGMGEDKTLGEDDKKEEKKIPWYEKSGDWIGRDIYENAALQDNTGISKEKFRRLTEAGYDPIGMNESEINRIYKSLTTSSS